VKYLFVHQNFPGQFLHLVRHLVAAKKHDVVFITEPNANVINGVRKVPYRRPQLVSGETHPGARELDAALRRAETVARTAENIKQLGFEPDVIIGHHGWGELLNIRDVWPKPPVLGYMEFFYHTEETDVGFDPEFPTNPSDFPRIRAKNAVNLLALNLGGHGQTPTKWQHATYPAWARPQITLVPEGADLKVCKPNPKVRRETVVVGDAKIAPGDKLVTYVARELEPYRGFHVIMRALPELLRARKDVRVVMLGGDSVSYGNPPANAENWRQAMLDELGSGIDPARVFFPGKVDYETYLRMLQRSDAHIYFTYPFVTSWSLREALATGCAVIASDTGPVREFIRHGRNGLLTPFLDHKALTSRILDLLDDPALAARLRGNARAQAEQSLDMSEHLKAYNGLINNLVERR
jgi:glycosyltransferase involved in cell wall biosynthesis